MKDYVAMFQQKIAEIDQEVKAVYIVNAGNMNHGKSSLFNSLLDKIHFAEEDIRTTVVADKVLWQDNVYLVDTPGLDAEDTDDKEAYKAYPRANVIIFVHTLGTGELHANELAAINKIKTLFASEEFFWQHFCLVLTAVEEVEDEESLAEIKDKIMSDMKNICGGENFKTFLVSNPCYRQGRDEDDEFLLDIGGIAELRDYLRSHVGEWLAENDVIRKTRIHKEKEELQKQLEQERTNIEKTMEAKEAARKAKQQIIITKLENIIGEQREREEELKSRTARLSDLKHRLKLLREKHEKDKAKF